MTYEEFQTAVNLCKAEHPILLLEGKRDVLPDDRNLLVRLGEKLAKDLPHCIFRSGNASGADELFAEGVSRISPERLQLLLPKAGARKKHIPTGAYTLAVDEIDLIKESDVIYHTKDSAEKNIGLIDLYMSGKAGPAAAKAPYLIRDTIKVIGVREFEKADFGLFYDDLDNPGSGGTGHTMRVCKKHNVPVITQKAWFGWML